MTTARPVPASPASGAWQAVDPVFAAFRDGHGVPGVSYGVVAGGRLVHFGGLGAYDLRRPDTAPGPDTVFRIASMTKSVTAACVLLLRDEGRLRLDDPVTDHVPELTSLAYPTADSPALTLRALLTMSSGLVEDDPWADRQLAADRAAFDAILGGGIGFDRVPGTGFEYSNLGYAILGRVVANAAGRPVQQLASERLFTPLGLTNTTWDADGVPDGSRAVGYSRVGDRWAAEPPLPDGAFGVMGGLASSVRDLARLIALHLAAWPPRDDPDPGPVRRASLREMAVAHTPLPVAPTPAGPGAGGGALAGEGYGYGLMAGTHARHGRVVGHSGGLPGFSSHMEWLPERGVGVVLLANRTYVPARQAVRDAFDALSAAGAIPPAAPPVASDALTGAQDAVTRLYEHWDPAAASAAMLDTYFLDRDVNRRPPDLPALRERYGPVLAVGEVVRSGRLRGSWRLTCERGVLEVSAMLGPTLPSRIQFLRVTPQG